MLSPYSKNIVATEVPGVVNESTSEVAVLMYGVHTGQLAQT